MTYSINPYFVGSAIEVFCPVFFKKLAAVGFKTRELFQSSSSLKQLRRGAAYLNKSLEWILKTLRIFKTHSVRRYVS
jgi:hypothetical protein